jgi:hypothetical protein
MGSDDSGISTLPAQPPKAATRQKIKNEYGILQRIAM